MGGNEGFPTPIGIAIPSDENRCGVNRWHARTENISLVSGLPSRPATIDEDGITGDQGRRVRGEKDDGSGYVHGLANSVQGGDTLDDISAQLRVGEIFLRTRSVDERGCNRIHRDVVLSPFDGQAFGEMGNGGLGHAVDRLRGQGNESGL
jgi:hypothetical protein